METTVAIEYLDKFMAHVGPQYEWKTDTYHMYNYGREGGYDVQFSLRDRELRDRLRKEYAFAIPTPEAIEAIAAHGPVVEIGAGSGYWAMLLSQLTDVVAYDSGAWKFDKKWFCVRSGGPTKVREYSDRTLFLCWPPYDAPMAYKALRLYRGNTVAFVGEGDGGCTADDRFWTLLQDEWTDAQTMWLPQWHYIHDYLSIWKRKD